MMTFRQTSSAYLCPSCYGEDISMVQITASWNCTAYCNSCGHTVPNITVGSAFGPLNPKSQVVNGRYYSKPKPPPPKPPKVEPPKPVEFGILEVQPVEKKSQSYIALEVKEKEPVPEASRWEEL